jgi:hypothetical protein
MRTTVVTAVLVVLAFGTTALANPIPTHITPSGIAHSDVEVFLLGAAAALLEWIVIRDGLRGAVRDERRLAGVVAVAHLLSYPATVKAADRLVYWMFAPERFIASGGTWHDWYWWAHAAELVAVGVEFAVYFAAFRLWRRSPVAPPPTVARLLGLTVLVNALTWSLGMAWSAWWHGEI